MLVNFNINPSSPQSGIEQRPLTKLEDFAETKYGVYGITDKQFDLSRSSGGLPVSLDIVIPDQDKRHLITQDTSESVTAVHNVGKALGELSVPRIISFEDGIADYILPYDASPVIRLLRYRLYGPEYMKRAAKDVAMFVQKIYKLDSGLFGLSITDFATYRHPGSQDDDYAVYMLVPPVAAEGAKQPVNLEKWGEDASEYLHSSIRDEFVTTLIKIDPKEN